VKTQAVWLDQLVAEEVAALEPGVPAALDRRPDVLVVGGGMVGVASAVACRRAGLGSVTLVERERRLGAGASGGAAGLLVPESHHGVDPAVLVDLGRLSLGRWRELQATVPGGVGLLDLDWFGLEPLPAEFAADLPPSAERLDAGEVARLVPGLAGPVAAVRIRHQARLNPLRALARLAAALTGAPLGAATGAATVATGVAVLGATVRGGRVVSVSTTAGEISPGAVIFATGGPPVLDRLELDVPSGSTKGHLLATEPTSPLLPGTVAPLGTQLDDGRLLSGGTLDTGDDSPAVRPDVVGAVWREIEAGLPLARGVRVSHQWCCFRPTHPDGLPVIDRVPGLSNAWLTSGHFRTGILMAPATGQALADWIASGRQPPAVVGLEIARLRR
jgi:glycine oxidase